ncbi:MAG: gamma-butyrobetaine hydroxylase-like domain-containing protein, partial [Hydrogenophaga sp.]|nr:gamma-butyrobetaine hydroxylase-like domain-containing protein [Hydrogenophaga sp.]
VGNYAVQPTFSDGHDSGIFSWDYLYFLGSKQAELWADYNARLQSAGMERDAPMAPKAGSGCGRH